MDDSSPAKRRKLDHFDGDLFVSTYSNSAQHGTAFSLQTAELLEETKLDQGEVFGGADDLLRRLKGSVEAIEPHEEIPVRLHKQVYHVHSRLRPRSYSKQRRN
jgi:U3 small nucleolar RNA-associated protein 22